MAALGALLVDKTTGSCGAPTQSSTQPAAPPQTNAGSADGGLLGGLEGLVETLQNAGHGETVNSWIGKGPNKSIDPGQLGAALGQQNVSTAAQQAGMNEQELLTQLSRSLPQIVDKLSANGKLPNLQQIAAAFLQK
jgi:uncharacterized protein YidB (DUF937 family)